MVYQYFCNVDLDGIALGDVLECHVCIADVDTNLATEVITRAIGYQAYWYFLFVWPSHETVYGLVQSAISSD